MAKKSNWYKIEKSREARLWIGTAVKTVVGMATVYAVVKDSPELRSKVEALKFEAGEKVKAVKTFFKK